MSDIIIEGKNLDDINQSNFQTVGIRGSFYAPTTDFSFTAGPEGVVTLQTQGNLSFNFPNDFRFGTLEDHANRFGQTIDVFGEFGFLLKNTTVEPWQGRLHYDYEITSLNESYFNFVKLFDQYSGILGDVKYPYFYTGDVYSEFSRLRLAVEDTFKRIETSTSLTEKFTFIDPPGQNLPVHNLSRDSRFSLGTYTENNKQFWERQTSDPRTRKSQFTRSKMQTAFGELLQLEGGGLESVVTSDEERFSVDALLFTDRETKRTPLCFYYDKNLHPTEYKLASNGKVFMQIELRDSGRDIFNQIDLYSERKAYRPFRLGFVKEELDGGRGDVFGEGLYAADSRITITSIPIDESYMLGIFDSDGDLKSPNETYTFFMPEQDVEYQARFRPNPIVKIKTRYIDPDDGTFKYNAGDESKGKLKVYPSKNDYDSNDEEYSTVPLNGSEPDYSPIGEDLEVETFRPTSFGGSQYTVKQEEVTNNYSFQGFTYLSSSNEEIELPISEQPGADLDLNTLEQKRQKSFDIKEHFRYPLLNNERVFEIYATYKTAMFTIENFNNSIDFENGSFEDAIIYGPVKWAIQREQGSPDIRYDDLVEFPIFESNDGQIQRLLIKGPGNVVDPPVINQLGYELGVFQVFQPNLIGDLALQSEISDVIMEQVPITYQSAKEYNGGSEPPASQGPTTQGPNYQVGDTFGLNGVFILNSVQDDIDDQEQQDEDEPTMIIYNYNWGGNPDVLNGVIDTYEQIYKLTDFEINEQGYVGVRLVGDINDDTGLLSPSGASTTVIGQEIVSQIRQVPLQLGTYVKCVLSNGLDTNFELTNVGSDEIVRPKADSGVIDANMFNFAEQVRFQITPNEPAEQPFFNVFVWDDEDSTLKNINDDDINLTKEQLGVTFDWNGGGNFGTLNYNMPDSRTDKILISGTEYPAYFKYIEFRFTVPQEEDFDGNEGGDEQVDDEFHVRLNAIDIPGTGGQIRLEDDTVLGTGNAALDLFPTEDGDFSELTVEQRTIRLRAVPASGIAEGEWSVVADPGVNTNTIGIIDQVSGFGSNDDIIDFTINSTGDITISYNWSGDDSYGGP